MLSHSTHWPFFLFILPTLRSAPSPSVRYGGCTVTFPQSSPMQSTNDIRSPHQEPEKLKSSGGPIAYKRRKRKKEKKRRKKEEEEEIPARQREEKQQKQMRHDGKVSNNNIINDSNYPLFAGATPALRTLGSGSSPILYSNPTAQTDTRMMTTPNTRNKLKGTLISSFWHAAPAHLSVLFPSRPLHEQAQQSIGGLDFTHSPRPEQAFVAFMQLFLEE